METERYLFFSNSDSRALICAAVKAVRGRFFRSSAAEAPPPLKCAEPESSGRETWRALEGERGKKHHQSYTMRVTATRLNVTFRASLIRVESIGRAGIA